MRGPEAPYPEAGRDVGEGWEWGLEAWGLQREAVLRPVARAVDHSPAPSALSLTRRGPSILHSPTALLSLLPSRVIAVRRVPRAPR